MIAVPALLSLVAAAAPVAAQTFVWIQRFEAEGSAIEAHFDEAFAATAGAGFVAVQGWLAWFGSDEGAERVREALARHRLIMPAAYTGGTLHDAGRVDATIEAVCAAARRARRTVGLTTVVINPDARGDGAEKTEAELATQARALDALARRLGADGIAIAVHAHDKEMRSGAREWRHILRHTTSLVGICVDVHWAWRGGVDPVALLRAAGRRLRDVHLRNSVGGVWTEALGPGDVSYAPIARALRAVHYDGMLTVELAYAPQTVRAHGLPQDLRTSRRFVREVFGR
jgi:sugar phosphate isomerase/epimerase